MRINRGLLGWGAFLILLGAVPLAVRTGAISSDDAARAWTLWPLLLIAGGIGVLLKDTPLRFAGGLLAAAVAGLIGGGFLAGGGVVGVCDDRGTQTAFAGQTGSLGGAAAAVSVDVNCGSVTIRTVDGTAWRLDGTSHDGEAPVVDAETDRLRIRDRTGGGPFGGVSGGQRWELSLPRIGRLDVDAGTNAGTLRVDLGPAEAGEIRLSANAGEILADLGSAITLDRLTVDVNAGNAEITMPAVSASARLDVNAGQILVCTPPGVGVRITADDNVAASYDFPGLDRNGDVWETPGFATAGIQIELAADANAGRVALNPTEGCGG